MILTDKCKQDFKKWFEEKYSFDTENQLMYSLKEFYNLSFYMQYGVLVDFLNTFKYKNIPLFDYVFNKFYNIRIELQTHNDLVKQAIIKANEIYNNR